MSTYSKFIYYSSHVSMLSMLQLTTRPPKIDYCNFINFVLIFFFIRQHKYYNFNSYTYLYAYRCKSINI